MSKKLTRRGARNVTSALDNLATAIQQNPEIFGIESKIAKDFAFRCDLLSDAIETTASINFPRKAADEEGLSVKTEGWDADQIADKAPGPLEHEVDESDYMKTFDETEFHELGEREESGSLENGAKAASSHGFNLFE